MKIDERQIIKFQESEKIFSSDKPNIINKNVLNKNYPLNNQKREKIYTKIFIAITYFALVICMEQLYRETLFDKSIGTQEDIREDHNKDSAFYDFWKFISVFGTASITFPVFFCNFPLFPNKFIFFNFAIFNLFYLYY